MYYSSPLTRRAQVMQILCPDAKPVLLDSLRECDFDDWEGRIAKELESDSTFLHWMESGQQAAPSNGEGSRAFLY